jgi:hypothetical protein
MSKSRSSKNTGIKYDGEKPDYSLIPFEALDEIVKVLTYGARKYGRENWHKLENLEKRYFAACLRHLSAYGRGERLDQETGKHHLAHAGCCVLFILWKELKNARTKKCVIRVALNPELSDIVRRAVLSARSRNKRNTRVQHVRKHVPPHRITGKTKPVTKIPVR